MKVLLIILSILASCPAYALTCKNDYGGATSCAANSTAAGDCQTLGFSKDNTEGCAHYLYCPFDTSYKRCASMTPKSCTEMGFTQEDKSSWCDNITICPTDTTYSLCASSLQKSCIELGFTQEDKSSWCDNITTCPTDTTYSLCASATQKSCMELGFTTVDKSSWCTSVVNCPTESSYTLCAATNENPCPVGYDKNFASVSDCGSQGSNGWQLETKIVPSNDGVGTITCGKCLPKSCNGDPTKKSVADCGSSGSQGWNYSSCYYGEEFRGRCGARECNRSCPETWKEVQQYSGDTLRTCFECGQCMPTGGISACLATPRCTWLCYGPTPNPVGYDQGSCGARSQVCCSTSPTKPFGAVWQCPGS